MDGTILHYVLDDHDDLFNPSKACYDPLTTDDHGAFLCLIHEYHIIIDDQTFHHFCHVVPSGYKSVAARSSLQLASVVELRRLVTGDRSFGFPLLRRGIAQVLAAIRGGVKHVLLPVANQRHVLEETPVVSHVRVQKLPELGSYHHITIHLRKFLVAWWL